MFFIFCFRLCFFFLLIPFSCCRISSFWYLHIYYRLTVKLEKQHQPKFSNQYIPVGFFACDTIFNIIVFHCCLNSFIKKSISLFDNSLHFNHLLQYFWHCKVVCVLWVKNIDHIYILVSLSLLFRFFSFSISWLDITNFCILLWKMLSYEYLNGR